MIAADRLSLNTATVKEKWNLQQCVDGCLRHGLGGIGPWRDKLHEVGIDAAARIIRESGLPVSGLCRGGWFTAEGTLTSAVVDDNKRAVDEAVAIGAECLIMVVGGMPDGSRDIDGARQIVKEGLAKTLDYARSGAMPIAIEPLHPMYAADRACVNTTAQALDICDDLGEGIGVALDVYHVWWDPQIKSEIKRAGRDRLLGFHICDWLVPTRNLLTDRGMVGDGVADIAGLYAAAQAEGYDGLVEVEIFSDQWWNTDPDEVLATMIARSAAL